MSIKYMGSLLLVAWPMLSSGMENYLAQNGFKKSLPLTAAAHKSTVKLSNEKKTSTSKMKRSHLLVTKRQLHKNQVAGKKQTTPKKQTGLKKSGVATKQKTIFKRKPIALKNSTSTATQVKAEMKIIDPKQYSKECASAYERSNFTKAISICQKAAEHNDSQAALKLAKLYSTGTANSAPDYVKAHYYATMAANQNNAEAQFLLALSYENGIGVSCDKTTAFKWYQQAAKNHLKGARMIDDDRLTVNPSFSHMTWPGTAEYKQALKELKNMKSRDAAIENLTLAAEKGHPLAEYQLGMEYLQGENVVQDDAKALNWLTQSADKGNPQAQTYLAWMHLLGLGTTQNVEQAVQRYLEAMQVIAFDESNPNLQETLATLTSAPSIDRIQPLTKNQRLAELQRGIDLLEMSSEASSEGLSIVTKAAEENIISAQLYLAALYQQGDKVAYQPEKAAKWYQQAAHNGNSQAQYALGWLYYYGQGVPQNSQQALAWFTKASAGDPRAKQAIAFVQVQKPELSINIALNENNNKSTIASKVREKVADNVNGIFKAMGFSGFSRKS